MYADEQILRFFGTVNNTHAKEEQEASPAQEPNKRQLQEAAKQNSRTQKGRVGNKDEKIEELTKRTAFLVVRQEEELKVLKQDYSIVLWFRPGPQSILHFMFQQAKQWKSQFENQMTEQDKFVPLRTVLATSMVQELGHRLEKLRSNPEMLQKTVEKGWRDANREWKFQQWNPQLKHLEEDSAPTPISDKEAIQKVHRLAKCLQGETVMRFHSTRPLTEVMESPATFLLEVSGRSQGARKAWDLMMEMQGRTLLQLI